METSPLRAYLTGLSISAPSREISGDPIVAFRQRGCHNRFVTLYNYSTFELAGRWLLHISQD
jgi:hypothetical protein